MIFVSIKKCHDVCSKGLQQFVYVLRKSNIRKNVDKYSHDNKTLKLFVQFVAIVEKLTFNI